MRHRSKLRRAGAIAGAICAAIIACTTIAACGDREERAASLVASAAALARAGDHEGAARAYREALSLDPNRVDAHFGLAKSHLALGQLGRAHWELSETARLDPQHVESREMLASLVEQPAEARSREGLERAFEAADELVALRPDDPRARLWRGLAHERQGRAAEALADHVRARELAPDEPSYALALARLLKRRGDTEEAEAAYRALLDLAREPDHLAELAALVATDPARAADAEALLREALRRAAPDKIPRHARALAAHLAGRGREDEADAVLEAGAAATDHAGELVAALAQLRASRGAHEAADDAVAAALRARPRDASLYLLQSDLRHARGDLEGALAAVDAAFASGVREARLRVRKVDLLVDLAETGETARLAEARALLGALPEDERSPAAQIAQARLALAEGDTASAEATLKSVVAGNRDLARAHLVLGLAKRQAGRPAEAILSLERAAQLMPASPEPHAALAELYETERETELAAREMRAFLALRPDDAEMRLRLARCLEREGRTADALAELARIAQPARDGRFFFALGRLQLAQGDRARATSALERAAAELPGDPELLEMLVGLDLAAGRAEAALARIEDAVVAAPDDARLARLSALALAAAGHRERAERASRRAIELDPNEPEAYRVLASLLRAGGRADESLETLRAAVAQQPAVAALHFLLGTALQDRGDVAAAMRAYDEAVRLDPGFALAKNNLAFLLCEEGADLDRALDLAQGAVALAPESPHAADTLGWVLYKRGLASAAIVQLRRAEAALAPEDPALPSVRQHLALAYEANEEPERARAVLLRALAPAAGGSDERAPDGEPAWAGEMRAMLARLGTREQQDMARGARPEADPRD